MIIKNVLHWGKRSLKGLDSAALDAELLLSNVLQKDRTYLMAHDEEKITLKQFSRFRYLVDKRKKKIPVAYILGHKEFYGLDFKVNKHVLIPRPDTEILVESVIAYLKPNDLLVDVGTGSGCIPIPILKHQPQVRAIAIDISKKALRIAEENASLQGVENRIQFYCSDLLKKVPKEVFDRKNVVVTANLPYVPPDYEVNEEANFEPKLALYAKNNGLGLYQKLFDQLVHLKPKAIFIECYEFQIKPLTESLKSYHVQEVKQMLGEARMVQLEEAKDGQHL